MIVWPRRSRPHGIPAAGARKSIPFQAERCKLDSTGACHVPLKGVLIMQAIRVNGFGPPGVMESRTPGKLVLIP